MIGVVLLMLAPAGEEAAATARLVECIGRRDRGCLGSVLAGGKAYRSPEYLSAAAEAYLMLGRNAEAMGAIEGAVSGKPGDFELLMQRGRTYQRCGEQVKAIESLLLAAKGKATSEVFYDLGLSFFLLHEYERAGRHFRHAVQLDEKSHKAEFMLGVIDVLKDNNLAGGEAHLERALALEPRNPHYLLHYGIVLMENNDREGAMTVLEKAVKADGGNPLVHFNLGRLYRQMGQMSKARMELEEAVRLRPELARAYYQLASVYRALGEPAKAKQATERFLKYKDQDRDDDPIGGPPSYAFKDAPAK